MLRYVSPQAESWITEKLQTASDESYKDPANLESKLQKHQAFEAELTAHEEAIDAVRETGEELITSGHFAAEEVERRIEALYLHWEELLEASANKGKRLEEARDHQKFNQEVDIADSCISEKVRGIIKPSAYLRVLCYWKTYKQLSRKRRKTQKQRFSI